MELFKAIALAVSIILETTGFNPSYSQDTSITEPIRFKCVEDNIFKDYFKNPYEESIMIFKDGKRVYTTNFLEDTVYYPFIYMDYRKLKIENMTHFIHNHPVGPAVFSEKDCQLYFYLLHRGFNGVFLLYHSPTGNIYQLERKVK